MYGTGPDVLLRHENVEPEVHEWIGRELGYTPFPLIKQLVESVGAGAIVPAEELAPLPRSYVDQAPKTDAAFTFIAGARNRMFLPEGQRLSFKHFDSHRARPPPPVRAGRLRPPRHDHRRRRGRRAVRAHPGGPRPLGV